MHKSHIFDPKNNAKILFLPTYLPYFFRTVTGNKQFFSKPKTLIPMASRKRQTYFICTTNTSVNKIGINNNYNNNLYLKRATQSNGKDLPWGPLACLQVARGPQG